ncbi:serine-rich adhesin for platelets [Procambarus clarkii]|uniref:serine-rich adhesin for platelets n=1 Tax=Procambarus clarkii TaxID=6728 RepID=UPI001E673652|nr:uncharacterized protein LOC123770725 [Procambarus clarkii]XP_045618806.1 uncharacterized protein LOC123770725 [Procambarus clarkii]XP_045618807.1 uncharacterized protein LOC123770725 [Procambarus clarkii]
MIMEYLTIEDNRPEKRHIQSECDPSEISPPKIIATPRRSRVRTPLTNSNNSNTRSSHRIFAGEKNTSKTRSSSRTPEVKRNDSKTGSFNKSPVVRSTKKIKSFNSTPVVGGSVSKSKLSSKIPVVNESASTRRSNRTPILGTSANKLTPSKITPGEGSAIRTISYRTPVLDKSATKTRLFKRTPVQECKLSKTRSSSKSPEQKQFSTRDVKSSSRALVKTQSCKSTTVSPSKTQAPEKITSKSLTPEHRKNSRERSKCSTEANNPHCNDKGNELNRKGDKLDGKQKEKKRVDNVENIKTRQTCQVKVVEQENHSTDNASSSIEEGSVEMCDESELNTPEDAVAVVINKDIQAEVEKVKRRRSTIGRGRKSGQSIGGRQSLSVAFPVLDLKDQICLIDQKLPWASRVSGVIDISIREALRRLQDRLPGDECVSDLRMELMRKSESIAGEIAYKIAGLSFDASAPMPNLSYGEDVKESTSKIEAYKKRTKELEQEFKTWKTIMSERKAACLAAEREFREAKSGEAKIDDDQASQLTPAQASFLASKPNYHQYLQDVQMARESATQMLLGVQHSANIISNMITATRLQAEYCCAAIEEKSFGYLKTQPTKSVLASLLQINRAFAEVTEGL